MGRYDEMLTRFMALAERAPRILMGVHFGGKTARPGEPWVQKAFEN